jgi:hypothetical protein
MCCLSFFAHEGVGLTPTGVQRHEIESQARLISRPDRGRQPTDGCGPLSRYAYTKGGEGLGAHTRIPYELRVHARVGQVCRGVH